MISKISSDIHLNRLCSSQTVTELTSDGTGVPNNNQRGRGSGPRLLWVGLVKSRHIVPTALLVRVQCIRSDMYKAVEGPSTRPIVLSMSTVPNVWRLRRLTIFEPNEMRFALPLSLLVWRLYRRKRLRFLQKHSWNDFSPNLDKSSKYDLKNFHIFFEAYVIYNRCQ